jgi:hypothetical protein
MAIQMLGEFNTTQPTYTTSGQHTKIQTDSRGNMRVVLGSTTTETADVLGKATGSDGGLGKIAALAASEWLYFREDLSDQAYSYVDWLVQTSAKTDVAFFVATSMVDSVDITLDAIADTNTIVINGLTYTGKANAAAAVAASRYFRVDASGNDADAVVIAARINCDYAVTTAGTSVAGTDKLVITVDDGAYTVVAGATEAAATGVYGLSSTVGTELASIVTTINTYVPGVLAVASGATGELTITPTTTEVLTVTESGDQLTVVDIDCPGVLATAGTAKVTLTPGTPASVTGELATVLQVTGTAVRTTISKAATLLGLIQVDAVTGADLADNSTTAGRLFHQSVYGYPYAYCGCFADGTTPTLAVSAIRRI